MREKVYIFVDDEREGLFKLNADFMREKGFVCFHCHTAKEAISLINRYCNIADIVLDLDHDLADETETGYTVCKAIVENQIPIKGFYLHTKNPVGQKNMYDLMTHYGYSCIGME